MWSVISSGAVALVAVVGTVTTGFFDRRARRDEARTERQQARLERAYLELVTFVHRQLLAALAIRRDPSEVEDEPSPQPLTDAETEQMRAMVWSIASDEVRGILKDFDMVVYGIMKADASLGAIADAAAAGEPRDWPWGDPTPDFDDQIRLAKTELYETENRLHEQIRRELAQ